MKTVENRFPSKSDGGAQRSDAEDEHLAAVSREASPRSARENNMFVVYNNNTDSRSKSKYIHAEDETEEDMVARTPRNFPVIVKPDILPEQRRSLSRSPVDRSPEGLSPHHEESTHILLDEEPSEPEVTDERLLERARYFVTPKKARWNLHGAGINSESSGKNDLEAAPRPSGSPFSEPNVEETSETFFPSPLREEYKPQEVDIYGSDEEQHQNDDEDTFITRTSISETIPGLSMYNHEPVYPNGMLATSRFRGVDDVVDLPSDNMRRFGLPGRQLGRSMEIHQGSHQGDSQFGDVVSDDAEVAKHLSKDILSCHLCSFVGENEDSFSRHMRSAHFKNQCPYCGYCSRTIGRLRRHVTDFHSVRTNGGEGAGGTEGKKMKRQRRHKCRECDFVSQDQNEYWHHIRTHIPPEKQLLCPHCPFVTACKHHMEYHLRNHLGSKPFKCNSCNYQCINKAMLKSHMKSHSNVYPYRCADCSYAAKYVHALNMHITKTGHTVWMDGGLGGGEAGKFGGRFMRNFGRTAKPGRFGVREGTQRGRRCEEGVRGLDERFMPRVSEGSFGQKRQQQQEGHSPDMQQRFSALNQSMLSYEQNTSKSGVGMSERFLQPSQVAENEDSAVETRRYSMNNFWDFRGKQSHQQDMPNRSPMSSSQQMDDIHRRYSVGRGSWEQKDLRRNGSGVTDGLLQSIPSIQSFSRVNTSDVDVESSQYYREGKEMIEIKVEQAEELSHDAHVYQESQEIVRRKQSRDEDKAAYEEDLPPPDLIQFPLDLSSKPKFNDILRAFYGSKDIPYQLDPVRESLKRKMSGEMGEETGRQRAMTADWPALLHSGAKDSSEEQNTGNASQSNWEDGGTEVRPRAGSFPASDARTAWKLAQERELRRRCFLQAHSNFFHVKQLHTNNTQCYEASQVNSLPVLERFNPVEHFQTGHRSPGNIPTWVNANSEKTSQSSSPQNFPVTTQYKVSTVSVCNDDSNSRTFEDQQKVSVVMADQSFDRRDSTLFQNDDRSRSDEVTLECPYCRIIFPDHFLHTLHMGYHSQGNPFQCNKCGLETEDHREFFLHIARVAHD